MQLRLSNYITDEPIELDRKSDLDEGLESTYVHCTQGRGQPDNDTLDVEIPSAHSDGPDDERCSIIYAADINSSSSYAKRVRFSSPRQIADLDLSTPPHSCDRDGNRRVMDLESSDSDESRDGITSTKRQKLSPQVIKTASDERNGRSPSVISDVDNVAGLENLSDDNLASNIDIGIPTTPDSAGEAARICPQFVDIGQEWEYSRVLGEEVVDGVSYYEVEWCPSLIPKSSVRNIEVLAEYEARKTRARACGITGKRKGRPPVLKRDIRAVNDAGVLAGEQQKRPRGRPRKETIKQF